MLPFADQTVVVTGASSGIGRATAVEFAALGANLVVAARSVNKLETLATELKTHPGRVLVVPTDVTRPEQVQAMVDRTVETFGRLDVLVNNAGAGLGGRIADIDPKEIEELFRLNVMGAVYGVHAAVPVMRRQGGGVIVNVSSPMARMPLPSRGPYAATKAALDALNWAMQAELARDNIHVMLVYPGLTRTEFFANSRGSERRAAPPAPSALMPRAEPPERIARKLVQGVLRRRSMVWFSPLAGIGVGIVGGIPAIRKAIARRHP